MSDTVKERSSSEHRLQGQASGIRLSRIKIPLKCGLVNRITKGYWRKTRGILSNTRYLCAQL